MREDQHPTGNIKDLEVRQRLFEVLQDSQSKERKMAFLIGYAYGGGVSAAERASGIDMGMHYVWLRKDPAYVEAFKVAQEVVGDLLEQAAYNRAVNGVLHDVYYQGEVIGQDRQHSDGLLKFLLKGNKPQKYMERTDITSSGQGLRIIIDSGEDKPAPAKDPGDG